MAQSRKAKTEARQKGVGNFHHKSNNIGMSVVEKDAVVRGMLDDELSRCDEALAAIYKALLGLPKGSLSVRKKVHKSDGAPAPERSHPERRACAYPCHAVWRREDSHPDGALSFGEER